ncbi:hypothetical protein B0T17DRAFT_512158 [Bombardia bombarda]|uniref:Nucleoside phosphorylase domain-containing protein n=1 Tax=Bombardia bombarda TaxID=252184 RepID=A0AA39TWY9_9PEZI|nr:hypothetical protein B0T17DRAFT_512158 [Bombardia bombarda]
MGSMPNRGLNPESYAIGLICALPCELAAARAMLDHHHENQAQLRPHDNNTYVFGSIGSHNIVIACLPAGVYGTTSAATVATEMLASFPKIRFAILVGIGGGVPGPGKSADIRLGDVVVSKPSKTFGGVVQYDFGKTVQRGAFGRTGALNGPPLPVLTAVAKLQADHMLGITKIPDFLDKMLVKYPTMRGKFSYPGQAHDQLFDFKYDHPITRPTCDACDRSKTIRRDPRAEPQHPVIHYGTIASGNQVMRHGVTREHLRGQLGVLCFEMEAAGLMNSFPCLVVRGICDYADSHKNKKWQEYAAATAAAYAKELVLTIPPKEVLRSQTAAEATVNTMASGLSAVIAKEALLTIPPKEVPSSQTAAEATVNTDTNFKIPFSLRGSPRIAKFVGRDHDLTSIENYILPLQDQGSPNILALHGVGGIGKTQLAIEFAKRHRNKLSAVFWINGETERSLRNGLASIIQKLPVASTTLRRNGPQKDKESIDRAIEIVLDWLQLPDNFRWLVIFDNIDNQVQHSNNAFEVGNLESQADGTTGYDIRKYLDRFSQGSIIITTRLSYMSQLGGGIKIDKVSTDEGLQVMRSAGVKTQRDEVAARELAQRLDGLPLALNHAAHYMAQTGTPPSEYLQRYNEELAGRKRLLEHTPRLGSYNASMMVTWEISLAAVCRKDSRASKLLSLCSFLSRTDLFFDLFRNSKGQHASYEFIPLLQPPRGSVEVWQSEIAQNEELFYGLVEILLEYSFLRTNDESDSRSYSIHPVIQDWGRERLTTRAWEQYFFHSLIIVAKATPSSDQASAKDFKTRRRLVLHADRCIELLDRHSGRNTPMLRMLFFFGILYCDVERLEDARKMYERALPACEKMIDKDNHPALARLIGRLASVYASQGRFKKARAIIRRIFAIHTKDGERDILHVLETMMLRARIHKELGRHDAAEAILRLVIKRYQHLPSCQRSNQAGAFRLLSDILGGRGLFDEAQNMLMQAKSLYKSRPSDLSRIRVFECFHDLGKLYYRQGQFSKAKKAYHKAHLGYSETYGPEDSRALRVSSNIYALDRFLSPEDNRLQIERLREQVRMLKAAKGPESIPGINIKLNLSKLLSADGELEEAEAILKTVRRAMKDNFSPDHPLMITILSDLNGLCRKQKRFTEARLHLEGALSLAEKHATTALDSVNTFGTVHNLGVIYMGMGMVDEAEAALSKALQGFQKILGPSSPWTIMAIKNMSRLRRMKNSAHSDDTESVTGSACSPPASNRGRTGSSPLPAFDGENSHNLELTKYGWI